MTTPALRAQPPADGPAIIYGTAWKGEATADCTRRALARGFRAIDTAGQPKHYNEAGVGEGLAAAMAELELTRDEVFIQTKYTPPLGQGRELPYDPKAAPADQVEQSLARSLANLGTDWLDSYLLHAPDGRWGMADVDWARWRALEAAHDDGRVRRIGISNAAPVHLRELFEQAQVRPVAVQNRCFARSGWDRDMRVLCAEQGVAYQGFSLLTANRDVLDQSTVRHIAGTHAVTPAQIVFAFARGIGMVALTGTSTDTHMDQDLAAVNLALETDELAAIEAVIAR